MNCSGLRAGRRRHPGSADAGRQPRPRAAAAAGLAEADQACTWTCVHRQRRRPAPRARRTLHIGGFHVPRLSKPHRRRKVSSAPCGRFSARHAQAVAAIGTPGIEHRADTVAPDLVALCAPQAGGQPKLICQPPSGSGTRLCWTTCCRKRSLTRRPRWVIDTASNTRTWRSRRRSPRATPMSAWASRLRPSPHGLRFVGWSMKTTSWSA